MDKAVAASEYTVVGMTCGHCVSSVTEEVTALDGVRDVDVDLQTGQLRVDSDRTVSRDDVRTAVEEAGYELA
ncbi:MAG TPA: cation transporter [Nocardioidaceae bacterium]|jgi:copper ion binding protein|nr:cation transporter [Nocardioidaceae bacterium]